MRKRVGRLLGKLFVWIGALLLGAALFSPWYFYNEQPGAVSGDAYSFRAAVYFLIPLRGGGAVQYSCPSSTAIPNFCPTTSSYSDARLNNTGRVAGLALTLAATGLVIGVLAGALGGILGGRPRWAIPVVVLALLALVFAVTATASFAGLLPGAFANDIPGPQRTGTGPWSSFYGSVTLYTPGGAPTSSWGPSTGWYLSIAAIAALLTGTLLLIRLRHDLAPPTPSSASPEPTSAPDSPR